MAITAVVAPFGTAAIAGYGMGGRLEYLLIPIVFGLGRRCVPLVGANTGAGNLDRVRETTRSGFILGGHGMIIGLVAALFPNLWMSLFTTDTAVLETGKAYLRIVGPAYTGLSGGLALFFAAPKGRGE